MLQIPEKPRKRKPKYIKCPQTSPIISICYAKKGSQRLRFCDSMSPECAAKPFGAVGLQLYVAIGKGDWVMPDETTFLRIVTKTPFDVEFAEADNRKNATYYARWVSARGEVGPWSNPTSMTIAA
jgi:hypothetical protein